MTTQARPHQSTQQRLDTFAFNQRVREKNHATPRSIKTKQESPSGKSHGASHREQAKEPAKKQPSHNAPIKKETDLQKVVSEFIKKHNDCLLGFDQGGKYKFFGDHARLVRSICHCEIYAPGSKENREKCPSENDPYAYVVIHTSDIYSKISLLTTKGYKVGLVDLVDDDDKPKSSIKARKLTKVFSEATSIGEQFTSTSRSKYIVSIAEFASNIGICVVDLRDPEVIVEKLTVQSDSNTDHGTNTYWARDLDELLSFIKPVEIVSSTELSRPLAAALHRYLNFNESLRYTRVPSIENLNEDTLISQVLVKLPTQDAALLDKIIDQDPVIQLCIYNLIHYLHEFGLESYFDHNVSFQSYHSSIYINVDMNSLIQIGVFAETNYKDNGSLYSLLNRCKTNGGQTLLRKWLSHPLKSLKHINERLDAIMELPLTSGNSSFLGFLERVKDIETTLQNLHFKRIHNPVKIYSFLQDIKEASRYSNMWGDPSNFKSRLLEKQFKALPTAFENCDRFLKVINAGKTSYAEFFNSNHTQYDEIEDSVFANDFDKQELSSYLTELVEKTGFKITFVDFNQDPYHLKIAVGNRSKVPDDWIILRSSGSGIILTNHELDRLRGNYKYSKHTLYEKGREIYRSFLDKLNQHYEEFRAVIDAISTIDCLISLKVVSITENYVRPRFEQQQEQRQFLRVQQSWNPVVENALKGSNRPFVKHNISMLSTNGRVHVITGPNMGGKSTYVREVALIVLLAQTGCFVPAYKAELSIFDNVLLRMGSQDNIIGRKSTFMVEMSECNYILQNATDKSLVILDEVGRGTSTSDGRIIAECIMSYLASDIQCLTIFITHFPEVATMSMKYPGIISNYHVGYEKKRRHVDYIGCDDDVVGLPFKIRPTFELRKGAVKNSFGTHLAEAAGIPADVVSNANFKANEMRTKSLDLRMFRQGLQLLKYLKYEQTQDTQILINVLYTLDI